MLTLSDTCNALSYVQDEVDPNGEQDPYTMFCILPRGPIAKSQVALNGGKHPIWNSSPFSLNVKDANLDIMHVSVLDCGEEDNTEDTLVGDLSVSVYSLLAVLKQSNTSCKTWTEDWYPLFTRDSKRRLCGEIRLEYRFVSDEVLIARKEIKVPY